MMSQILAMEMFCDVLLKRAGLAYISQYLKREKDEKYYSEDDSVNYAAVEHANNKAEANLIDYTESYIELHQTYLDSPLDLSQSYYHAKRLLETYDNTPGDQEKFEAWFSKKLTEMIENPDFNFDLTGYSSDDDEYVPSHVREEKSRQKNEFRRARLSSLAQTSSEDIQCERVSKPKHVTFFGLDPEEGMKKRRVNHAPPDLSIKL